MQRPNILILHTEPGELFDGAISWHAAHYSYGGACPSGNGDAAAYVRAIWEFSGLAC